MKKVLLFGVVLLSLWGCSLEEGISAPDDVENTDKSIFSELCFTVSDTTRVISSQSKALDVAMRFLEGSGKQTRVGVETNVTTISQENGAPAMYVINYGEDGGFVIVSAEKDAEPILAYSDSGSFCLDNINESAAGMWLNDAKLYVEHASTLPDSLKLSAAQQWESLTSKTVPVPSLQTRGWKDYDEAVAVYYALEDYRNQGYEIYENPSSDVHNYTFFLNQALDNLSDEKDSDGFSQREKSFLLKKYTSRQENVLPKTTTTWDQGDPYNGKLLIKYPKATYLGCVTVAVAQLMKYYGKPNGGFKYDKMPDHLTKSYGEGYEVLSDFLLLIGEKLGINYSKGNSNSSYDKGKDLLKSYGFSNAKCIDYKDFFSVKSQIGDGPIGLRAINQFGVGHMWVCDGYDYYTWHTEYMLISYNGQYMDATPTACFDTLYTEGEGNGSYSMHMNWGWGGTNDGYFSEKWEVMGDSGLELYSKERKAVINLN